MHFWHLSQRFSVIDDINCSFTYRKFFLHLQILLFEWLWMHSFCEVSLRSLRTTSETYRTSTGSHLWRLSTIMSQDIFSSYIIYISDYIPEMSPIANNFFFLSIFDQVLCFIKVAYSRQYCKPKAEGPFWKAFAISGIIPPFSCMVQLWHFLWVCSLELGRLDRILEWRRKAKSKT